MQIPFEKSSIIFLSCKRKPETSSFWTNILVMLVTFDVENNGGNVFFPKLNTPCSRHPWGDGLVKLPDLLNIGRKKIDVNRVLHRVMDGDDERPTSTGLSEEGQKLDSLIDRFLREHPSIQYLRAHEIAKENPKPLMEWICPDVPSGGVVVWHGFHTTQGDKNSFQPKATVFLDYAERNMLGEKELKEYTRLIRAQPFDPGAGNANTRGSRTTIEFNCAKNIPQQLELPNTRLTGREGETPTAGTLSVTKENVLHQGYAVIAPVLRGQSTPAGCFRWEMAEEELREYNHLRQQTKQEFERFLTYYIFEREIRFLICWLSHYTEHAPFRELWNKVKLEVDMFDPANKKFKFRDEVKSVKNSQYMTDLIQRLEAEGKDPKAMKESKVKVDQMSKDEYTLFNAIALNKVTRYARHLDVSAKNHVNQETCWKAIFGGTKLAQTKAAAEIMNDPYFMYWRLKMGNSKGNMCTGTSLDDLNAYFERKVGGGIHTHPHGRCAQAGGIKVAGDSGMGGATTYVHGAAHIRLQVGKFGATLARAFYTDPLVVFERFRVKTHAAWGAGHVDHDVRSRTKEITF